jgi:hypothetical protein
MADTGDWKGCLPPDFPARQSRNQTILQEVTEEAEKMNDGQEDLLSSLRFLL